MKNLQAISGFMFFFLGSVYFCLALLLQNNMQNPSLYVAFNILDVPFAIVALLYAGSSLKQSFIENDISSPLWNYGLIAVSASLFASVIYINFFLH